MTADSDAIRGGALPSWVPQDARHYLQHTETGQAIRSLARDARVHASTVLRQIRKVENARDDPLVDAALRTLSARVVGRGAADLPRARQPDEITPPVPTSAQVSREANRVLRRLAEGGAVLAMAREMEKAVVVREGPDGTPQRVAVVDREVAQALALKEWIAPDDTAARVVRYRITGAGRSALKDLMALEENRAQGFGEAMTPFLGADEDEAGPRPIIVESPIYGLARRRDVRGAPFLDRALVAAGERLREDYELALMDPRLGAEVAALVEGVTTAPEGEMDGSSPAASLRRVQAALFDLGPGLGDVALRACCLLEGMEHLEKRMGWSARSAKIVLRIALQRLQRHYHEQTGQFGPRIG